MKDWVETTFDGDPMAAIKMILSSKSSGQIVLNVSQGTVCGDVVWRERKVETVNGGIDHNGDTTQPNGIEVTAS